MLRLKDDGSSFVYYNYFNVYTIIDRGFIDALTCIGIKLDLPQYGAIEKNCTKSFNAWKRYKAFVKELSCK